MKPTLILDTEVYRNYFLLSFRNVETGNVRHFEMFDGEPFDVATVRKIVTGYRLVSFNGINFDLPLITMAICGASCDQIKTVADKIIKNNLKAWAMGVESMQCDHIDLIEVAPGIAGLKIYGGRLHTKKMQDLPIEPDALIDPAQRAELREYCENDLANTLELFRKLEPQIELRAKMSKQYGIDLRSKSDAQIAEAVIRHEVEKSRGSKLPKPADLSGKVFRYTPPPFIRFSSVTMQDALEIVTEAEFIVQANGVVKMPDALANLEILIGEGVYRMGIGGLHSSEKRAKHLADDNTVLIDRDVASYYPAIILNCGYKPASMGEHFTAVYRSIVARRLEAKRTGDKVTADALKITVNGSFGKFGSKYSVLYSPDLLIQTTVTGQLSLLMLIEALEYDEGIQIVSANTDGIVIKCPRKKLPMLEFVIWEWETLTGFETEETRYRALYSRDVNNYIAIKEDGGVKLKGVYAPAGLQKNPTAEICSEAVLKFLRDGDDIRDTIWNCQDVRKFVTIRTVKGGALDASGNYLGKAVRWYYSTAMRGQPIRYKVNGYTVARSEGARPLMQLPDAMPADIDFDWYLTEAQDILKGVGA